jgi:hypothetical protein
MAQADAFNAHLTNLQQGIGHGRAMLTCFGLVSGAQAANDRYWANIATDGLTSFAPTRR